MCLTLTFGRFQCAAAALFFSTEMLMCNWMNKLIMHGHIFKSAVYKANKKCKFAHINALMLCQPCTGTVNVFCTVCCQVFGKWHCGLFSTNDKHACLINHFYDICVKLSLVCNKYYFTMSEAMVYISCVIKIRSTASWLHQPLYGKTTLGMDVQLNRVFHIQCKIFT